jgi:hypothetical protein
MNPSDESRLITWSKHPQWGCYGKSLGFNPSGAIGFLRGVMSILVFFEMSF